MVIIMSGIPGSGKSTYAREHFPHANILSADDFFVRNGIYTFDPKLLKDAHEFCLRRFAWDSQVQDQTLIVDNTNTTALEICPYAALALAYGHELKIITLKCDVETAFKRNKHNVPLESIQRMHDRLEKRVLPKRWPNEVRVRGML